MKLKSLPITKRKWQQAYLGAKRSHMSGPLQGHPMKKKGSIQRNQLAHSVRQIRAGKVYKFKK